MLKYTNMFQSFLKLFWRYFFLDNFEDIVYFLSFGVSYWTKEE